MEELEIKLNNEIIKVKIIRKNNKNIYFRFDEQNNLIVTTNKKISTSKIIKLINENNTSLIKLLNKSKNKQENTNELRLLGLKYDIIFAENITAVTFNDGIVYAKNKVMLDNYLNQLTKQTIIEEINKILKVMPNIPQFTLKIRKMKTRWGVCNYVKQTVTLNSELIKHERNIIDYVIVHEFSHFTHHNHSKDFWNLVKIYYPDYKKARKELRET